MNHALHGLAVFGSDRVADFHAPGRPQFGNLEENSSAVVGENHAGDPSRPLVIVVGAIVDEVLTA